MIAAPSLFALIFAFAVPWPRAYPLESDLRRFPHPRLVAACRAFNQFFLTQMRTRLSWDRANEVLILEMISEAEGEFVAWDCLDDAQRREGVVGDGWGDWGSVRWHLDRLRGILGDRDYDAGRMPPPVPLWMLAPIDR